jgi:hypothetical protein
LGKLTVPNKKGFLQNHTVSKSIVDLKRKTLAGIMLEEDVAVACKDFEAK